MSSLASEIYRVHQYPVPGTVVVLKVRTLGPEADEASRGFAGSVSGYVCQVRRAGTKYVCDG